MDVRTLASTIDIAMQVAGLAAIGVVCRAAWRKRAAVGALQADPAMNFGPGLLVAALITFTFLLFQQLIAAVLPVSRGTAPIPPGSHDSNLLSLADSAAKLAATAMIVLFFLLTAPPRRDPAGAKTWPGWWVVALAFFASLPLCYSQAAVGEWVWNLLVSETPAPDHPVLKAFAGNEWGHWGRVMLVAIAVLIAPITEELYFRGLLLGGFLQLTKLPWLSIALSAIAFGLAHGNLPHTVAPIVTLGLILGYVRVRLNSIQLCIMIHALFNGRTMALILLDPTQVR